MRYRQFGTTGWAVSEIGFGAWQIGGDWGDIGDGDSVATLLQAFERGINFVDTAQMYGNGRSETVVGEALRHWRHGRIYVATKVQPTVWPSPDDDRPQMRGRYPAWHLREAVETSLRRLGVECIDLLQLHCWLADGVTALDWLETLNALKTEGKIDKIGVSIRDYRPSEGIDLVKLGLVSSLQVVFNLFEQRPAAQLFPVTSERPPAFIARVPLDSGALTGVWTKETYASWTVGSVPHSLFRGERFTQTLQRVEQLKRLCAPFFPTLSEAAMRFALSPSQVSTVIPGMLTVAEVDANVTYSDGAPFPAELLVQLAEHAWPRNYYR